MSDSITKAIVRLYDQERFYAEILLQMDRFVSDKIPTAGVCVKDRIQLYINPKFFDALKQEEQVAILKHECQHILNNHIERGKEIAPEVYTNKTKTPTDSANEVAVLDKFAEDLLNSAKHRYLNVAADCSINVGIPNLPEGGVYPKTFKLKDGQTFEWYAEKLKNNKQAKDFNSIDDHSLWTESEGDKEEIKEKIKQAVKTAAMKTKAAGKLTSEEELLIDRMFYKPRDWKSDLKQFAARALETAVRTSKKKRNRRYGIMYPGMVKEEVLHIGVAIDTSGSISDEALCQFMAEINNMSKYATITVVEADSEVKNSYVFDPKKTYKIKGRGGTAYQPAFDYFTKETDVDGVIYLGDMDTFGETLVKPKYPVLWAVIGNQNPPAQWGSKTKVEVKMKGSDV